jgi:hypothetical protein
VRYNVVVSGALSFVFFVAFLPSVDFAGALEAIDIGAVDAGLGAIARTVTSNSFSSSAGELSFIFFVAFTPSVDFAGALEALDIGALPAVDAGLGCVAGCGGF